MKPFLLVLLAFLLSRGLSYFFLTVATEPGLYRAYALEVRERSLTELYRGTLVRPHALTGEPHRQIPEYPQLTALFLTPPLILADTWPGLGRLIVNRPRSAEHSPDVRAYEAALGLQLFAVDVLLLALVALSARRLYPGDSSGRLAARLGLYVAATALFASTWFDRLDVVVGLCGVAAVLALQRGWVRLSYAVLVAGSGFKLVPLLLLPVWVFAAAARSPRRGFVRESLREAVNAGLVLAAGLTLLYAFGGGNRALSFLEPHSGRGVQPESLYGPLVVLGDSSAREVFNFGGFHLTGTLAAKLAASSSVVLALLLGVALIVAGRAFARTAGREVLERTNVVARQAVWAAALVWLAFLLGGKVASPQYVIWLMPLWALLPLATERDRRLAVWFLSLCAITTLIYPVMYSQVTGVMVAADPPTWAGPTPLGLGLIVLRNAVLAGLFLALAWRCEPGEPPARLG